MELTLFSTFAIASQTLLLAYFACRRWLMPIAGRFGWMAYAFGALGAPVGLWLISGGAPWALFAGPLLFAAWAGFGAWADMLQRIEWRRPVRWNVLGPYLTLYLAAQMFLWWPLWDYWRPGWVVYLLLFVANTGLNIWGHFGQPANLTRHTA